MCRALAAAVGHFGAAGGRTIGQPRSTQRKPRVALEDEAVLSTAIVKLESEYGRYGYRRITEVLRAEGCWRMRSTRRWRRCA